MCKDSWDVFLGAGIRQSGCVERNQKVIDTVHSIGMTVYAPQIELPLGCRATAQEILEQNCVAIEKSSFFLFVPDGAGEGVYYELGMADAQKKLVIGYSPNGVDGQGKVAQGRWALLPHEQKASSLRELREALKNLVSR